MRNMQRKKRGIQSAYRVLATGCGAILFAFLAAAFMLDLGLPVYQVVAFTLFGTCLATLLGFSAVLAIEDSRRYGSHHH